MKPFFKNILILTIALGASYFLGFIFGRIYLALIPQIGGGGFFSFPTWAEEYIVGWPLSCIFFIVFLFTAFGDNKKHWWITISLIPAILFEAAFDSRHLYFPILIGLAGWLLGKGLNLLIKKINSKKSIIK